MSRYMQNMSRWGCRAACFMITALLIELPAADASAQTAGAQANLCFDIISTRNTAQLEGAILLNRCTGQSWLLTRNGRRGRVIAYRWNLLVAEGGEIGKPLPRPEVHMPAPVRPSTEKCFTFQERQFCE
jgi:hypothetical protein